MLCATADEVLANLPGAGRDSAPQPGLVTRFFGEGNGGRRLLDEFDRLKARPKAHSQLLELFHACLALGFQDADRALPEGATTLQDIRRGLYELLRKATPAPPRHLSPHWEGRSRAARSAAPFWAAASLMALLLFGVFIGLRIALAHRAEAAAQAMISLNPLTPVSISRKAAVAPPLAPSPTPAQSSQLEHVRTVLEPQIASGSLSVERTANQIVFQIPDQVLFQPGTATIRDEVRPLMIYIALALDDDKGAIKVAGHSDDRPGANARFASNFELSLERAKTVGALLKQSLLNPERVEIEGKGADAPIASNDTAEGRDRNRRIEIIMPRSE
ncbi:type IVB secretion system protein IcmH/DotU [Methylocapsa polymorpha]|uniref:Type IVB secretion system protein IcmH/DotU n=1 Tax=Methylocapsa polymorpha TaxID=3080828 RepID=A0ABZ0HW12_9HYPH|nr:type IVB secretion system protein IcmH/DotU [Methylocapsa sp. RX1]